MSAMAALLVCALPGVSCLWAQGPTILEYPIPTEASRPSHITQGSDGNLWFTETGANKIAKITTSGSITEYSVPTPNSLPFGITQGPDGNIWFTELSGNNIGKVDSDGNMTEYALPTPSSGPMQITLGPDGNLWFTEFSYGIGKITVDGAITEYSGVAGRGITRGSDGNLWFTTPDRIVSITPDGAFTVYRLSDSPASSFYDRQLDAIALGPDANVWAIGDGRIWRVDTNGATTPYPIPTRLWGFPDITRGAKGDLWFTESYANQLGRITTSGVVHEYSLPTAGAFPHGVTQGPEGNVWFTMQDANKIGVLVLSTVPEDPLLTVTPTSLTFTANAGSLTAPDPQALTVTFPATASFEASASSYGPWLSVSPAGELHTDQVLTVNVNLARLAGSRGSYTAYIAVSYGDVTQTVPVTLHMTQ